MYLTWPLDWIMDDMLSSIGYAGAEITDMTSKKIRLTQTVKSAG